MTQNPQITQTNSTSPDFPEAKGIVFTQLFGKVDGQVIQFNVTSRAETLALAIDDLIEGVRYAKEVYKLTLSRPDSSPAPRKQQEAPATDGQQQPAPAQAQPAPAQAPAAPAYNPNDHIVRAIKLEIAPEADDKVSLKWYEAGHQYPDITTKRSTEKALELLRSTGEAWEEKDLWRACSRQVHHDVYWRESEKLNGQGRPYKNIVQIVAG